MYFSQFCRLTVQDQGCSQFSFWWDFSSWLEDSWLLSVCSHHGETETEVEGRTERDSMFWHLFFNSVQLFTYFRLFVILQTAACQASLSITNSLTLLKLMSIESVMPSNHLTLCQPLLLLASIFPSIRVFSNESVLHIRWPKYCSFQWILYFQWIFRTDFL